MLPRRTHEKFSKECLPFEQRQGVKNWGLHREVAHSEEFFRRAETGAYGNISNPRVFRVIKPEIICFQPFFHDPTAELFLWAEAGWTGPRLGLREGSGLTLEAPGGERRVWRIPMEIIVAVGSGKSRRTSYGGWSCDSLSSSSTFRLYLYGYKIKPLLTPTKSYYISL